MRNLCDSRRRRIGGVTGMPTLLKSVLDGKLKWIERHILYVSTEVLSTGSSIFKVPPEQVDTLRRQSGPGLYRDG